MQAVTLSGNLRELCHDVVHAGTVQGAVNAVLVPILRKAATRNHLFAPNDRRESNE